jgi:hypothetical protein
LAVSHELGHALGGLPHQHQYDSNCQITQEYHPGIGEGPLSFDPLMGGSRFPPFFVGITNWFGQTCTEPFYGAPVYDFQFLNNQVAMRVDDFPDVPTFPSQSLLPGETLGILERDGDVDLMLVNFKNGRSVTITSDNIDLKVSVLAPGGQVLEEYNDPDSTGVTIPSVRGLRYLKVEAASNDNLDSRFMTGTYKVTL